MLGNFFLQFAANGVLCRAEDAMLHRLSELLYAEKDRWIPWVPVLFGMGIGFYFALPQELSIWWTLGAIELLIVLTWLNRLHPERLLFIAVISLVVAGFTNAQLQATYISQTPMISQPQTLYLQGRVAEVDYNSKGNVRLLLYDVKDFNGQTLAGKYKITLLSKQTPVVEGECVEMVAKLMPPFPTSTIRGYQYDRRIFFEGIKGTGYAISRGIKLDCPTPSALGSMYKAGVEHLRDDIVKRIKSVLPSDEAAIAAAIIAGDRGHMSQQLIRNYQDSGLAHFLSISGLHMSMLAGLMFFLIRLIISFIPPLALRYDSKIISAWSAIFISAVYLVISGATVPTQRAFIMTFIVLLGVLFSRQAISMLTISWAAMIVLLFAPEALVGASFQMSFAAVVALIAFYERFATPLHRFLHGGNLERRISVTKRLPRLIFAYIVGILVSDFIASAATLPFSIYHFNRIALYTTLGNLLAGPVIGLLIMPFVLIVLLLMPFGLEYWPLKILGYGISLANDITAYVASLPGAGMALLGMPMWGLILISLGGLWLCLWQKPWRLLGWIGIVAGSLSMLSISVPDVLVDNSGKAVAVKDEQGNMVVLPSRGKKFVKSIWQEKSASPKLSEEQNKLLRQIWQGKKIDKTWLDLECNKQECTYRNRVKIIKNQGLEIDGQRFDNRSTLGGEIRLTPAGAEINSIREHIGHRYWNK